MTYEEADALLDSWGWTLECWSPLEIFHEETQSRANNYAARLIIDFLWEAN